MQSGLIKSRQFYFCSQMSQITMYLRGTGVVVGGGGGVTICTANQTLCPETNKSDQENLP